MRGLLFSQMQPPAAWEDDFHDWYNKHHIPARMAIPGFASATRYQAIEGDPAYLACYFLGDMAALETPEYLALKRRPDSRTERMLRCVDGFTRYLCDELSDTGPVGHDEGHLLYVVTFPVPEDDEAAFDRWYGAEHVPLLMQVPGWRRIRRFKARPGADGPPWTHFALHEIDGPQALDRPERAAARDTPTRDALAAKPWFAHSGRWLYRPIHTAHARNGG